MICVSFTKKHLILHSHLSLRFFCGFFCSFSFKLRCISSSVKARKKIIRVFFHRIFCEQPKLFQICILRGPTPTASMNTKQPIRPATSASGVILSSEIRSREVEKFCFFLRWKNGNFGDNSGVCAQKEQLLPRNLTWNLKITR